MSASGSGAIVARCDRPVGAFKRIHGINLGPIQFGGAADVSKRFSEIRFPTVRLHDCPYSCWGTVDVPCVFPLPHLDPDDPHSYAFARTDAYVQSILDCGSQIVYRLGVSIQKHPALQFETLPPEDPDKWADICCGIIRHYNHGWAGGFRHGIRHWEIWNEAENGPNTWQGTYEQFTDFFIRTASRIKSRFPGILIGGPSFNGFGRGLEKLDKFLARLRGADCPLGFLSWHTYAERPMEFAEKAAAVREALDRHGYEKAENHLNEWNLRRDFRRFRVDPDYKIEFNRLLAGPAGSSMAASALAAMQDAPLDMTNYYCAGSLNYSMFETGGKPRKAFFAFKAFRQLLDVSAARVEVAGSDPDAGLAVLAGAAEGGRGVGLLLSNFAADRPEWTVELEGLSPASPRATSLVIDEARELEPDAPEAVRLEGTSLRVLVPRGTVRLVRIAAE
jgi:hypothetical protein